MAQEVKTLELVILITLMLWNIILKKAYEVKIL